MVWVLVSVAGLLVETCLIVVLGRAVTGPAEAGAEPGGNPVLVRRP
ncbi:hypothetical protein [Trujillonella endophytica]|uniref:Uncharacterized protein n=1 Tax=Trujillonella endophytica TaxID=673521 RepID=A0A1H8QNC2_9ACTN|nr:hypothetical protein [Trujillella endophytica]SEO55467.1 hypothetical protein SAMN05660991_00694 [Trujillella endophytica]